MFYILKYYKLALTGISVLLLASGFLTLFIQRRQGLKSLLVKYWGLRGKQRLWPLILAVLILNCFMLSARTRLYTSAGITLNYNLASQGLNPNGTRFNQTDILSSHVLERAIEKGALEGITAADLKNAIQVWPAVQGDSWSKNAYFISTQFVLQYNANKKTASEDGEKLLSLVTQAYKEWFIKEYSANTDILALDFSQAESQDYLDSCSYLNKIAESIGEYMKNMSGEEPAFRSSVNGETFQSMSSQAYAVSNTLVEKLEAYILEEGISRDAAQYTSRLNVSNIFLDFDARKAAASNENTLEAIAMYENDIARIVLVPTYDTNNQFYMSQTRIGVDDFAASASHYADEKVSIYGKIADNSHVIGKLSGRYRSGGTDEKAEALIAQIEQELLRIAHQAEDLVEEYNARQANRYMTAVISSAEAQAGSLAVEVAILTLLFAASLHLGWFAFEENRKRKGTV